MKPKLSILIVNWNAWTYLRECLGALCDGRSRDEEIIVVDNGSRDGSVEGLHRHFPHVRVHANAENLGHSRAVNQGFGLCRRRYVLLLDTDAELGRDSLEMLLEFMDARTDVAVVAPRTYNTDGTVQESARDFPTVMSGLFGRRSLLTKWFPNARFVRRYLMREKLSATEPYEVRQVSSACMLIRRDVLDAAGPWDEGYAGYWVDTDYCMRLQRMGMKIYCVPAASAVHHESNQAGKKKSLGRIWMFHMGAYRLYWRYYAAGRWDPRAVFALAALTARAGLQTVVNLFLPHDDGGRGSAESAESAPESSGTDVVTVGMARPMRTNNGKATMSDARPAARAETGAAAPVKRPQQVWAIPLEDAHRPMMSQATWLAEAIYCVAERVIALVALVLTLPLMAAVAALIKIDSRGAALFVDDRMCRSRLVPGRELAGRDDLACPDRRFDLDRLYWVPQTFRFAKLRTLVHKAMERHPELCWWLSDLDPDKFQDLFYKVKKDPRLTRVGRWLRKTSIDELPNFWSVLTGRVRLVGPRPESPEVVKYYTIEQMRKFTIKPGLTCLSKVHGRGDLTVGEQIAWDIEYVRRRSLKLDLKILAQTVWVVLTGKGGF